MGQYGYRCNVQFSVVFWFLELALSQLALGMVMEQYFPEEVGRHRVQGK
jgi:hypothetical protein